MHIMVTLNKININLKKNIYFISTSCQENIFTQFNYKNIVAKTELLKQLKLKYKLFKNKQTYKKRKKRKPKIYNKNSLKILIIQNSGLVQSIK